MGQVVILEKHKHPHSRMCHSPTAGCGLVRVDRGRDRSVVSRAYATSPLRLLLPRNHGHAAWIYTSSLGGGLVDGDQVVLDVEVSAGAAAFVSTQASTKVYRSPRGTTTELRARVDDGGMLIVAPDPVVCFAGARYRQTQRFEMARRACLIAVDWISSGRRALGERWAFRDYRSRLIVDVDGTEIVHDAIALRPEDGAIADRLGRFDVLAVTVIIGNTLEQEAARIVSRLAGAPLTRHASRLVAATPLTSADGGDIGCLVRVAGRSVEDVGATIRECLGFVPALLGDDPWGRKW
jgi:urease accessory protein